MKTSTVLVFTFICCQSTFGQQIDSSPLEFFPLHNGDLWQYYYGNYIGSGYYQNQVVTVSDTLLPNGKRYFGVVDPRFPLGYTFYRVDSLLRVQQYNGVVGDTCGGIINENNVYRLAEKDSSVWNICYNVGQVLALRGFLFRFNGVFQTYAFGEYRDVMEFQAGAQAKGDTVWPSPANSVLMRGIGIYRTEKTEGDYTQLTGAIINGVLYGKIRTAVGERELIVQDFGLQQNFPNPFNGTTLIRYSIPRREYIRLSVFDILGREITVLVNKSQEAGTHTASFEGINQLSGVYFYRLIAGDKSQTKSMIIQK